jgi:hypothetical protein
MAVKRLWQLRRDLLSNGGRVERMSVLIHNFMDASALDQSRCESCVFMVATGQGPLSMCVHNAKRDAHLFTPEPVPTETGQKWWSAATGALSETPNWTAPAAMPFKRLKGRQRAAAELHRKRKEANDA